MKRRKIAILGSNSFLGRNLIWELAKTNKYELFALDRQSSDYFHNLHDAGIFQGVFDFSNPETYSDAFWLREADHILCLVSASKPATYDKTPAKEIYSNVVPYASFLELLQSISYHGHIVFFSSGGTVYGSVKPFSPITENAFTKPVSSYGMGKLAIEHLVSNVARCSDFQYTVLRISNPIGRWQELRSDQGVLPAIVQALKKDTPFHVYGDGSTVRDYFDVCELADGVDRLLDDPQVWNGTYNVGSGLGHSVMDLIHEVEAVSGKSVTIEYFSKRSFDIEYNVLDNSKLYSLIGWKPSGIIRQAVEYVWQES